MANNIVAALKKLFSLAGDPQTIAEALDEAELSGGGGLPDVTAADKNKETKDAIVKISFFMAKLLDSSIGIHNLHGQSKTNKVVFGARGAVFPKR